MTTKSNAPEYHELEISLCGFSGAGKTTLFEKLIAHLSPRYQIGFVKSDAHRFEMDEKGKDTARAWAAGAAVSSIFDKTHSAIVQQGHWDMAQRRSFLAATDFVLVEGRKRSPLPKLVMLGGRDDILPLVDSGEIENVLAYVGEGESFARQPYFQRDDVTGIAAFVESHFAGLIAARPLRGLVLTGGESRRMGQDKATLRIRGQTQLEAMLQLLRPYTEEVYVSARPGQRAPAQTFGAPILEDRLLGFGPLGGILSAMQAHPGSAWLVVACDLPHLEAPTLTQLLRGRNPYRVATVFASRIDQLPEPLCAVYEPRMFARMMQLFGLGLKCPRKMLLHSRIEILQLEHAQALYNMNSPEDLPL